MVALRKPSLYLLPSYQHHQPSNECICTVFVKRFVAVKLAARDWVAWSTLQFHIRSLNERRVCVGIGTRPDRDQGHDVSSTQDDTIDMLRNLVFRHDQRLQEHDARLAGMVPEDSASPTVPGKTAMKPTAAGTCCG